MSEAAFQRIKDTRALPSPTGVALRLIELAADERATLAQVVATIEADPAMASRLLRIVNSPLVGVSRPVASVPAAIKLLGMSTVRNLALGHSLIASYRSASDGAFSYERFWSKSLARAVAARELAHRLGTVAPEEAFTIALLSEIGRLALATVFPHEYNQLLAGLPSEAPLDELIAAECRAFDIDHRDLTARMMAEWRLPNLFCDAVRHPIGDAAASGDADSLRVNNIARLLHAADAVATLLAEPNPYHDDLERLLDAARACGVDRDVVCGVYESARACWSETAEIFAVPTPSSPSLSDLHARATRQYRQVLVVDDDASFRSLFRHHVAGAGYEVLEAECGSDALQIMREQDCRLVVTDLHMPGMGGLELCDAIRRNEGFGFVHVVLVSGDSDPQLFGRAFAAGANDFLTKPYERHELLARLKAGATAVEADARIEIQKRALCKTNAELALLNEKLEQAAATDELTGLGNRRAAMERLRDAWAAAERKQTPLACMMIDIDHFKRINDTLGHDVGDDALRSVATALEHAVRAGERVYRLGGEEFLVVCPGSTVAEAAVGAERLRAAVEANSVERAAGTISLTVSIGVAERCDDTSNPDELLRAADEALYDAKRDGRNRVHEHKGKTLAWTPHEDARGLATPADANAPGRDNPGAVDHGRRCAPCGEKWALTGARDELNLSNAIRGEQARAMSMLFEFAQSLNLTGTEHEIFTHVINAATQLLLCRHVAVFVPDKARAALHVAMAVGIPEEQAASLRVAPGQGLAGRVFASRKRWIANCDRELPPDERNDDGVGKLTAPCASVPLLANGNAIGVLVAADRHARQPFDDRSLEYLDVIANMAASSLEKLRNRAAREQAQQSVVTALATLAEYRDWDTGQHLERVTRYALVVAEALAGTETPADRIDAAFLADLKLAMPLHDIGKVAIPDGVLLKPGALTADERLVIQTHAEIGARTLQTLIDRGSSASFLAVARDIAYHHHEHYDGSGYPMGLAGNAIPLPARIAAVVDVYDALTTRRPYKEPMSHEAALAIIRGGAGAHFDPAVVEVFLGLEAEIAELALDMQDHPLGCAELLEPELAEALTNG